jgi:hypothetical protein
VTPPSAIAARAGAGPHRAPLPPAADTIRHWRVTQPNLALSPGAPPRPARADRRQARREAEASRWPTAWGSGTARRT